MGTLGGLLQLSRSALLADQTALNATANNVANQNTVGYTDEVVSWNSNDSVSLGQGGGSIGSPTVTTTSLRDRVLEQRLQQQIQQQAGTSSEAGVLTDVENVFSITGGSNTAGSTQLGTSINALFSSLTALAANPSDAPTQAAAVSAASAVGAAFNTASAGLASVSTTINQTLATSVDQVNALTSSIAQLNQEISSSSTNGASGANTDGGVLEDQRDQAVEALSQLVGLDQIRTEGNGLTLTTTSGALLVSEQQSYALTSAQVGGVTSIYSATGADVTAGLTGGSIGGLLAAQNTDLPSINSALDTLAYRIGTAVNTQNESGSTSAGLQGGAIFTLPATSSGAASALAVSSTAKFATASTGEGTTGSANATLLAGLSSVTDSTGATISGSLAVLLAQVGTQSASLATESSAQQASLTQLKTQRDTLSAVNLDTEASNLTTYQRAYQAAAQVLSIVNELMASAINLGTETAVS